MMDVWVQWHRIPMEAITPAGLLKLAKRVGTPISEVTESYLGGCKFAKIKIRIDTGRPLKDKIEARHPTLGFFPIYLTYEKLHRICHFCAHIGHEYQSCSD